jgi:uncharacterized protein YdeI (YjbR/CyaY-like superfamily)
MGKKDARVDAYIAKSPEFAQPILNHLRAIVHDGCPGVVETIKWSVPHFDFEGASLCGMAAFKAHCRFGFFKAALLGDGASYSQFGYITLVADLPPRRTLLKLVKDAARLNEAGVKVTRAPNAPKAPVEVPDVLMKALRRDKRALAAFNAFPPSHKREYVEWITEAKRDETRQKRIDTALTWMAEGKPRNWKYMR